VHESEGRRPNLRPVRDDLYPLTKDQRRAAHDAWRRFSYGDRREACRRANRGLPAQSPELSAASLLWGQYQLHRTWANRPPRSAGAITGAMLTLVVMLTDSGAVPTAAGLAACFLGLLTWDRRRSAHRLVEANTVPDR
jgi:hypothetical protein